ncbi:MAG: site-2 protease family protein [Clostridium sp.]|uniref:site-2 protease family protein n=1 Tax=Clostridium sp. TaxID=1506 RepID=UPI0025B7AD6D|nr:site-2 protease family protein [Clostridium sp.]MCH3963297.1 site-2 protease family protein [Clostridium sp.]MCI1717262.1 site-2 protease family protein [Clostridium sp.]MCI1801602.1 site-2 protease family protein [Clostridium sp.]MCI1815448.1 site-2 protease family protein [Clostridium sp.]MCI1872351.1 site-2 protease family protein [Clostridium sp.]
MKDDVDLIKKPSIGKIVFNVFIVSLTISVLGLVFNFYYAFGYLLILIIHEAGHYVSARFLNLKVVFEGFTPFGAYIVTESIENCRENAIVAIGGPLFGGILGFIYYAIYYFTGDTTSLVLGSTAIILNLMNLIPVKPLDGGHIAEAISPIICYIGLPLIVYLLISIKGLKGKILLFFILGIGVYETYNFTKKYKNSSYFKLDKNSRIKFIVIYGIMLVLLAVSGIYLYTLFDFNELFQSILRYK